LDAAGDVNSAAVEGLENLPLIVARHAAAAASTLTQDMRARVAAGNSTSCVRPPVFLGVGKQVYQNLREPRLVDDDGIRRGAACQRVVKTLSRRCSSWPSHASPMTECRSRAFVVAILLVQPEKSSTFIDQPCEPLGLGHEDAEILRVLLDRCAASVLPSVSKHADH